MLAITDTVTHRNAVAGVSSLRRARFVEPKETEKIESPTVLQCTTESSRETLGIPEGGWQIVKEPQWKKLECTNEQGIYVVELNSKHHDLSVLSDDSKFRRLKEELLYIAQNENVTHLILSFYRCKNIQAVYPSNNDGDCEVNLFARMLERVDRVLASEGKKFSTIHAEIPLKDHLQKTQLGSQVHLDFPDAINNSKPRDPIQESIMKPRRSWADPRADRMASSLGCYPFLQNLNMEI